MPRNPTRHAARRSSRSWRALWDFLPVMLTGNYYSPFAWRRELSGVIRSARLVFWNIEKR